MTEITGHSKGIWRTFAVYREKDKDFVHSDIKEWFKTNNIRWSFQRYAWTKDENAHISFRIEFPTEDLLKEFRQLIEKQYTLMAETSWDEKIGTKRAYELGTKLYYLLMDDYPEVLTDERLLLQLFHGFFNDFQRDYREESSTYIYFLSELSSSMRTGLSLHDIQKKEKQ